MSNLDDFLARLSEGASHIIANPKTISDLQKQGVKFVIGKNKMTTKDKLIEQYWKDFGHWHIKMGYLTKGIAKLKKENGLASQISGFLLETQYIEFHLQGLITELELVRDTEPRLVKFSGKKKKKEVYEMTLGELKDEVKKYKADFLAELTSNLTDLNRLRIEFAHHLFSYATGVDDLLDSTRRGIVINDKVLASIAQVFKFIEEKSWFGKMVAKKKVNKSGRISDEKGRKS